MNRDFTAAVAGDAGGREQDAEEFASGIAAKPAVAGAGEAGMAVDAAERERGKVGAPQGPGRNDMRTRRHDPSEDLTEGMEKEPTATSATDAREVVRSRERAASRGVRSSREWIGEGRSSCTVGRDRLARPPISVLAPGTRCPAGGLNECSSTTVRAVPARAAGAFRRTPIERSDQRVAWDRSDQAFFAAGACHILAWVCRDSYPDRPIEITAVRLPGQREVCHTYAVWDGWAFDHSGWNPERQLLAVNADFEGQPLTRLTITDGLAEFCEKHHHRMPNQYWHDPRPRARDYIGRFIPPWR